MDSIKHFTVHVCAQGRHLARTHSFATQLNGPNKSGELGSFCSVRFYGKKDTGMREIVHRLRRHSQQIENVREPTCHREYSDKKSNGSSSQHDLLLRIISFFLLPARPNTNSQNKYIKEHDAHNASDTDHDDDGSVLVSAAQQVLTKSKIICKWTDCVNEKKKEKKGKTEREKDEQWINHTKKSCAEWFPLRKMPNKLPCKINTTKTETSLYLYTLLLHIYSYPRTNIWIKVTKVEPLSVKNLLHCFVQCRNHKIIIYENRSQKVFARHLWLPTGKAL